MGNYRFIPEEQKKLVITMLDRGQTPADIENATGISARTVQRVRRLWLSTGRVILEKASIGAWVFVTNNGAQCEILKTSTDMRTAVKVAGRTRL